MSKALKNLVRLTHPIAEHLPFFLIGCLLMGYPVILMGYCILIGIQTMYGWLSFFGSMALVMGIGYVQVCLLHYYRKAWIKLLLYALMVILFAFYLFLLKVFDQSINPMVMTMMLETNGREASEFMENYMLSATAMKVYGIVAGSLVVILVSEWAYRRFSRIRSVANLFIVNVVSGAVMIVVLFMALFSSGTYIHLFSKQTTDHLGWWDMVAYVRPQDPFSNVVYSVYGIFCNALQMEDTKEFMANMTQNNQVMSTDSLDVVLVIGESFIKWHSSLYGYPLETNPMMRQEERAGRLFAFRNVASPFQGTTQAIRHMLFTNSIGAGEIWSESVYSPAVFKSAGYNVFFWDNQKTLWTGMGLTFSLNGLLYDKEISKLSYTQVNDSSFQFDHQLIDNFEEKAFHKNGKQNFTIFHFIGQHFDTNSRYPHTPEFTYYTKDSIKRNEAWLTDEKKTIIATYDNATRYNDYVMQKIFDLYKHRNAVVVYLSDHGEESYDYRDSEGRVAGEMGPNLLKYQYEIPFFIWCSEKYKAANPKIMEQISKALDYPFSSDNLPHLLFNLGHIQSPYYRPERSIVSKNYHPTKRIVDMKYDYDAYRWKK